MGSKFDFRMSRSDYDDLCFDLTDDEHAVLDLRRRGWILRLQCIAASALLSGTPNLYTTKCTDKHIAKARQVHNLPGFLFLLVFLRIVPR